MTAKTALQKLYELPAGELEVLKQRARALAKPLSFSQSQDESELVEYLEIHSRGQVFAVPLAVVEGIGDLTALAHAPRAPPACRGIVSFRGEILLGLELSILLGSGGAGLADLRRLIILSANNLKAAIVAEKVVSIRSAQPSSFIRDRLAAHPFVVGVDRDFVTLLEPGLLIQFAFDMVQGRAT